jgi:hypothetical protein
VSQISFKSVIEKDIEDDAVPGVICGLVGAVVLGCTSSCGTDAPERGICASG